MKWFKHDSDANADAKLKKVRIKYGLEGYGLYWYCLEMIASEVSKDKLTFELEHDAEIIAHDTGIHYERVQEMMTYMVNLGLFEEDKGVITCFKMAQRLDQSMTSNPRMRQLINEMRDSNDDSHDGVMTKSDSVMQDKIRLDKKREEQETPSQHSVSTPPLLDDPEPAKPKRLDNRENAVRIMEMWNDRADEYGTNWQRVDDPEDTSAIRYRRAKQRINQVKRRMDKKGVEPTLDNVMEWFDRFLHHMGNDSWYSGHPTDTNPKGYRLSFQQAFREDYFNDAIERLNQSG